MPFLQHGRKSSEVVPVFKHGDRTNPDNYRPISLASCAFKVFEHLIHGRIPHILPRLDEAQGGFRGRHSETSAGDPHFVRLY